MFQNLVKFHFENFWEKMKKSMYLVLWEDISPSKNLKNSLKVFKT